MVDVAVAGVAISARWGSPRGSSRGPGCLRATALGPAAQGAAHPYRRRPRAPDRRTTRRVLAPQGPGPAGRGVGCAARHRWIAATHGAEAPARQGWDMSDTGIGTDPKEGSMAGRWRRIAVTTASAGLVLPGAGLAAQAHA